MPLHKQNTTICSTEQDLPTNKQHSDLVLQAGLQPGLAIDKKYGCKTLRPKISDLLPQFL